MADIMPPETRSRLMSRIRAKHTTPERRIDSLLRAADLDCRRHDRSLPGCPDFVFPHDRVAVFLNGDFWHGWRFPVWKHKLTARWRDKIASNRKRDRRNYRKLAGLGWKAVGIWEHQVEEDAVRCVARIVQSMKWNHVDWGAIRAKHRSLPPLVRRDRLPKP